jgi:hypothetical protein
LDVGSGRCNRYAPVVVPFHLCCGWSNWRADHSGNSCSRVGSLTSSTPSGRCGRGCRRCGWTASAREAVAARYRCARRRRAGCRLELGRSGCGRVCRRCGGRERLRRGADAGPIGAGPVGTRIPPVRVDGVGFGAGGRGRLRRGAVAVAGPVAMRTRMRPVRSADARLRGVSSNESGTG